MKVCGVGVAMLPEYSWAPTRSIVFMVNVGTVVRRSHRAAASRPGWERSVAGLGAQRGGGPVVVRARERRAHGEGDQQAGRADTGMPGGRW